MLRTAKQDLDRTIRLRRYRSDARLILSLTLAVGLLTASTVVSADAWLRLPAAWMTSSPDQEIVAPQFDRSPLTVAERTPPLDRVLPIDREGVNAALNADLAGKSGGVHHLRPDDYAESWQQADDDLDHLGETRRSHQVTVGPDGRLTGQIVAHDAESGELQPLDAARVWFSSRGVVSRTSRTDEEGRFEISGLQTGTYAVFASDADMILAYALHVRLVESDDPQPLVRLESPAVTGPDVSVVLSLLAAAPNVDVPILQEVEPEEDQIPEPVRPVQQHGAIATPMLTHPVRLRAGRRLLGRVRQLHPASGRHLRPSLTRVTLIRDSEEVAATLTDEMGWFALTDVDPGVYALVAVSVDELEQIAQADDGSQPVGLLEEERPRSPGFATFAIEVLAAEASVETSMLRPPSDELLAGGEWLELDFALTDQSDWFAFTRERGSDLKNVNRGFWSENSSLASQSRGQAPSPGSSPPPRPAGNNPPVGGGGNTFPFVPPESEDPVMSPASL